MEKIIKRHGIELTAEQGRYGLEVSWREVGDFLGSTLQRLEGLLEEGSTHGGFLSAIQKELVEQGNLNHRLEQEQAKDSAVLSSLQTELSSLKGFLSQISVHLKTIDHNLEQIRLLAEGLNHGMECLGNDLVERQIQDPLLREIARVYSILISLGRKTSNPSSSELRTLANSLVQFLELNGITILNPAPGDQFDPKEHQPLTREETVCQEEAGTIAKTYRAGFRRKERVVEPARVAVYAFAEPTGQQNTDSCEQGGNTNE